MNNGDVLWAWIAGVAVSVFLLVALSHGKDRDGFAGEPVLALPDAPLGAAQWDLDAWERTGGTPPRPRADRAPHDAPDALDGIAADDAPAKGVPVQTGETVGP